MTDISDKELAEIYVDILSEHIKEAALLRYLLNFNHVPNWQEQLYHLQSAMPEGCMNSIQDQIENMKERILKAKDASSIAQEIIESSHFPAIDDPDPNR